jgi:hypothetical protein
MRPPANASPSGFFIFYSQPGKELLHTLYPGFTVNLFKIGPGCVKLRADLNQVHPDLYPDKIPFLSSKAPVDEYPSPTP